MDNERPVITIPEGHWPNPPTGLCQNCNLRPAATWWLGQHGAEAANRGYAQPYCMLCCLRAQLAHAEERAAAIPDLRVAIRMEEDKDPTP